MKRHLSHLLLVLMLALGLSLSVISSASAAFNKNNLISDNLFNDYNSMNASQIDGFLNSFPSSCISMNKKFTAINVTGYNPTGGYLYGGHVSAGTIIYNAAQAYHLNPKVILTTLQKEQSLVSGTAGCSNLRYVGAMGYGCPDGGTVHNYSGQNLYAINGSVVTSVNGTCVSNVKSAGFSQQLIRGVWLLKFGQQRSLGNTAWAENHGSWNNSDDPPTTYGGPMTEGYRARVHGGSSTFYNGNTSIDGGLVHMDTGATASLYWYTPHIHGNQSFVSIYEGWFGSTQGLPNIQHPEGTLVLGSNGSTVSLIQGGELLPFPNPDVLFSQGYGWGDIKPSTDPDLALPSGSSLKLREGSIVQGSGPGIYAIENNGSTYTRRAFASWDVFSKLGYGSGDVQKVADSSLPSTKGTNISDLTAHPTGTLVRQAGRASVFLIQDGVRRPIPSPSVLYSYRYDWNDVKTATTADMTLSTGTVMPFREGSIIKGSGPAVYAVAIAGDGTVQKRAFSNWATFAGLKYTSAMQVSDSELPAITGAPIGP